MALDELKGDLMEANAEIKSYLAHSEEYLKLKVFKLFMVSLTSFAQILALGSLLLLALIFLSAAASLALGSWFENVAYGFLAVGLFYVVIWILVFVLRAKIDRPIIKKFSEHFFDED